MQFEQPENVNRLNVGSDKNTILPLDHELGFFGFRVGELGFTVPLDMYCEVIDKIQVNPLPNVRPWFRGLLNLRGNLVPVFDLRVFLQEGITDSKKRRLFVIGRGEQAVALWIDSNPELLSLDTAKVLDKPATLSLGLQHCVSGSYLSNGQVWLDVQLPALFKTLGAINTSRRK